MISLGNLVQSLDQNVSYSLFLASGTISIPL